MGLCYDKIGHNYGAIFFFFFFASSNWPANKNQSEDAYVARLLRDVAMASSERACERASNATKCEVYLPAEGCNKAKIH